MYILILKDRSLIDFMYISFLSGFINRFEPVDSVLNIFFTLHYQWSEYKIGFELPEPRTTTLWKDCFFFFHFIKIFQFLPVSLVTKTYSRRCHKRAGGIFCSILLLLIHIFMCAKLSVILSSFYTSLDHQAILRFCTNHRDSPPL